MSADPESVIAQQTALLLRIEATLLRGADFQLGPKGADRDLLGKIAEVTVGWRDEVPADPRPEPLP